MEEQISSADETLALQKGWQTHLYKANGVSVDENVVIGGSWEPNPVFPLTALFSTG